MFTKNRPLYIHPSIERMYELLRYENHEIWWHANGLYMEVILFCNLCNRYSYAIKDGTLICCKL